MLKGNKKVFLSKPLLYTLINLRRVGYSFQSLSILFKVDITSVRHQIHKYQIPAPEEVYTIERFISQALAPKTEHGAKYTWIDGELINLGRSYKDYL